MLSTIACKHVTFSTIACIHVTLSTIACIHVSLSTIACLHVTVMVAPSLLIRFDTACQQKYVGLSFFYGLGLRTYCQRQSVTNLLISVLFCQEPNLLAYWFSLERECNETTFMIPMLPFIIFYWPSLYRW